MTLAPEWPDLVLRLGLTLLAGGLIGLERGEHARPAGLRTVMLVCLAASLAMILANRLILTMGKAPDSFVQLDMMRLPLGVLTGVGFIGAGAIIHRDNLIVGVTTAATLWFATIIGLCLGAGECLLGIAGTLFGMLVLTGLRGIERRLPQDHQATLTLVLAPEAASAEEDLRRDLMAGGYRLGPLSVAYADGGERREFQWEVRWVARGADTRLPPGLDQIAARPGVLQLNWSPAYPSKA